MRIRKNAAFLYTNSNLASDGADECKLQKNLCQLNQSPWDIITFPSSSSSFHQFDDTEVYYIAGNGSSIDSVKYFESLDLGKYDSFVHYQYGFERQLDLVDNVVQ
ncbi:hypothetical protein L1987_28633 [Smallanthus sonchifolius]|uniref:Uncharacterized protein n=1 Tax=Smallanthus sonchifolius TaxID=185202 RepID=A0ACB9HXK9_9ASTR|nr:hypothetical protein L1987_28633 [Smallanthus sonchifolius]